MCPELVTAAQRIAAENPHITAQVYDLNHFPDLREKYQVMSVPCLVINDGEQVSFGKKIIRQLLELLVIAGKPRYGPVWSVTRLSSIKRDLWNRDFGSIL